ncbi:MAG: peroxiredoxin [Candidatus Dormibacteria bacterium]
MLKPGDPITRFTLTAGTGEVVDTDNLRGQRWVIYFYPKDNTPGCTIETGEFGRALPAFGQHHIRVFGCSVGEVQAKAEFAASCGAPDLPLLADPDHHVAELFGVWKSSETQSTGGISRTTFLIGSDGRVEQVWEAVKPAGHASAVLAATG